MKSQTRLVALLVASTVAALGSGCGSTTTSFVQTGWTAPPTQTGVAVVMEGAPLPDGFAEIALVQAVGRGMHADLAHVIAGLQEISASLGCTVVVRVHVDQGSTIASANGVCGRTR